MGARRKYPQFEHMTAGELSGLLRLSKLGPEEKEIAVQCIEWTDMPLVEIGVAHNMDRRTISRRMKDIILPELERMMKRELTEAGA